MGLYDRLLSTGWIYDRLRIRLLGGGPAAEVFGWLGDTREDVLVDIGCGTGLAMDRLGAFSEYHGFETDTRALTRFRQRRLPPAVHLHNCGATAAEIEAIRPTKAILMGLLHHLKDAEAAQVLSILANCSSLDSAITLDPVLLEGKPLNNLLCRLDRGKYARTRAQYEALLANAGLRIEKGEILRSGNGAAFYFCTLLKK